MAVDRLTAIAEALPGVKRKGRGSLPAWYLHNRLIARVSEESVAVVRVPLERRESIVALDPGGFGIPPAMEAHHKVEVYLDRVDADALRAAVHAAWRFQGGLPD